MIRGTFCVAILGMLFASLSIGCKPKQPEPDTPPVNTTNADSPGPAASTPSGQPSNPAPTPEGKEKTGSSSEATTKTEENKDSSIKSEGATDAATKTESEGAAARSDAPAARNDSTSAASVKIEGGIAKLGPDNTKILFVGTHKAPKKPDPRTGGFEKFTGKIEVNESSKTLKSAVVDIDTTSIWTQFPKLTDHLKSADFFEVREYPTAKFETTKIEPGDGNQVQVHGKLTLHGVTKDLSFPATVKIENGAIAVNAQFDFNRTDFGMSLMTENVDEKVSITVVVGEKTTKG